MVEGLPLPRPRLVPSVYSVLDVVLRTTCGTSEFGELAVISPKIRRYYKLRSVLQSRPGGEGWARILIPGAQTRH